MSLAFCLGPIGGTVIFAVMTGALVSRLEWFGLAMAGMIGLMVSSRLTAGEEGGFGGHGVASLRLYWRARDARARETREHRAARLAAADQRREAYSFANTASLAMLVVGLVMFLAQVL